MYDLDETITIMTFYLKVQNIKYTALFHRNRPRTLVELAERVRKYIDTKEFLKMKNSY